MMSANVPVQAVQVPGRKITDAGVFDLRQVRGVVRVIGPQKNEELGALLSDYGVAIKRREMALADFKETLASQVRKGAYEITDSFSKTAGSNSENPVFRTATVSFPATASRLLDAAERNCLGARASVVGYLARLGSGETQRLVSEAGSLVAKTKRGGAFGITVPITALSATGALFSLGATGKAELLMSEITLRAEDAGKKNGESERT